MQSWIQQDIWLEFREIWNGAVMWDWGRLGPTMVLVDKTFLHWVPHMRIGCHDIKRGTLCQAPFCLGLHADSVNILPRRVSIHHQYASILLFFFFVIWCKSAVSIYTYWMYGFIGRSCDKLLYSTNWYLLLL